VQADKDSEMKKQLTMLVGIYALSIALTASLWSKSVVLTLCLALLSIFMLYKWHTKSDFAFYFVPFVLVPAGEIVAVYFGAWQYSKPLYLIPTWLPLLWGIAALFMKKMVETFIKDPQAGIED
jgi:hypothetical protein